MQLTTVVHFRALWLYALLLFLVPVCKAQCMVPVRSCSSDSFSDHAPPPPQNYTFSSATTFCPASVLSGNDFGSWVLIPEGASDMDTNGTYCFEDPLGRFGNNVCVFDEAGKTLLTININLPGISLDPPGELFISFTSRAGRRTDIIIRYGPGRFSNLVNDDELDLGTGDDLPQLWNSAGLDRTNDVFLCEEGDGGLQDVLSFRVDSDALRESCSEQDVDSQRPPTGYTIIRRPDTTPELRGYSFILRWPRASPCTCSCTDCSDCSSIESTAVFITVKNSTTTAPTGDPTTPTESSGNDTTIGIAVGVGAGAFVILVVLVAIAVALYCYCKHLSKAKDSESQTTELTVRSHGNPVVNGKTSSAPNVKEAVDFDERSYNPHRTIHFEIDEPLKKNTDWFEEFQSCLESKHHARRTADMPVFSGDELTKQLQSLLQDDDDFDCLYLLWQGSLEQLRQNETSDSSELPMARIVQESMFCDFSEKKVVWVQFGLESPQPSVYLPNGILVVNLKYLPHTSDISGRSCAEEVFRSVGPMVKQRSAATSEVTDRSTRTEPNESTSTPETSLLMKIADAQEDTRTKLDRVIELQVERKEQETKNADVLENISKVTAETNEAALENRDLLRDIQETDQKRTYDDSLMDTTT